MHDINDPQMLQALGMFEQLFEGGIDLSDINEQRERAEQVREMMAGMVPEIPGVQVSDHHAPGPEGDPDVFVRIYQPEERPETLPALLWIHGGGYVLGDVEGDDPNCKGMALALNAVIASVEYRLAPEHPHPAPVEDCYAALKWLVNRADEFGIDKNRIAIGGASAGGGLAAGLALLVRDRGEIDVAYQYLIYPMIDDRNIEQASDSTRDTHIWSRDSNLRGWRAYLGKEPGGDNVSPYAAAARAEDVSGLPPAYIGVGTTDLFRDEDIEYAQRLMQAGVPTELHVYPDGFHGFDMFAEQCEVGARFVEDRTRVLRRALHGFG